MNDVDEAKKTIIEKDWIFELASKKDTNAQRARNHALMPIIGRKNEAVSVFHSSKPNSMRNLFRFEKFLNEKFNIGRKWFYSKLFKAFYFLFY